MSLLRPLPLLRRTAVLTLLASAFPGMAAEAPDTLEELRGRIERHIAQPRFTSALWGVKIAHLESGRTLYEHHAGRMMSPASNSKLYTGALALARLGGDYRIITPVLATMAPDEKGVVHGDLIVAGRGDPSWSSRRKNGDFWEVFESLVTALLRAGVRRVTGDVVADATYFRMLPHGAGWTADDLNDSFGAEVSAISLEQNFADIHLAPSPDAGMAATAAISQPLTGLSLDCRVMTIGRDGVWRLQTQRLPGDSVVHLWGDAPAGAQARMLEVPVPHPARWFAAGLRAAMQRRGIAVDGTARGLRWPDASAGGGQHATIAELQSPPLREMVAAFMKPSQNLEAALIFGHIGESSRTTDTPEWQGTESLAVAALEEFLRGSQLPAEEVRFEEGSGLSRNNLTTANATVELLRFMARHPAASDFITTLPVAGEEGTLRARLKGTAAEGNLRAKTGTLRYAHALSGYVTTAAGERLVFSLMLNRSTRQPPGRNPRAELDEIAVWLAELQGSVR